MRGHHPASQRSGPDLRQFLAALAHAILAVLAHVDIVFLRRLYVLVVIELGRRPVHLAGFTRAAIFHTVDASARAGTLAAAVAVSSMGAVRVGRRPARSSAGRPQSLRMRRLGLGGEPIGYRSEPSPTHMCRNRPHLGVDALPGPTAGCAGRGAARCRAGLAAVGCRPGSP